MNIWILNHHALTPQMGGGTRHFDFAKELVQRGHQVIIIASSFHYSKHQEMKVYGESDFIKEKLEGIDFVWLKTPAYITNGFKRVQNMLVYLWKVLKYVPSLSLAKPDIIIGSSVHLFAVYGAYVLSKTYRVPFVMEVRDLWPKTLIDMGLSRWHPFIIFLGWLEKFLYVKADKIISNLPYAHEYIQQFVPKEKVVWISNGVDLKAMPYVEKSSSPSLVVCYTGAIGIANNIGLLIEAAQILKDYQDIVFYIVGDGTEKDALQALVKIKYLKNIFFKDTVSKEEVFRILLASDILYFNLKDSPVFQYGISSNKLFDYMAAGRVVIFSANTKNNPIKEAQAGYCIEPDNLDMLVKTLLEVYHLPDKKRVEMGIKGRKYIETYCSVDVLVTRLERILEDEIGRFNAKKGF